MSGMKKTVVRNISCMEKLRYGSSLVSFLFVCFSVESNQLIEFTAVKVFVERFFYLFILCIVIDVVQLRLFVGVIGILG